jgi:hypothetical protein
MKAVFNLRGDNSAQTVDLAVDANQGWKGHESYMATVPVSSETISRIVGFFSSLLPFFCALTLLHIKKTIAKENNDTNRFFFIFSHFK